MAEIKQIKKPKKVEFQNQQMNEIERFLWWKKQYFMTFGIVISMLIMPIYAWKRGNIILGVRMSIIFYLFIILIYNWINKITKKKDELFLSKKGIDLTKPKKWYTMPLKIFFIALRIWILWIMYSVWMMTYVN